MRITNTPVAPLYVLLGPLGAGHGPYGSLAELVRAHDRGRVGTKLYETRLVYNLDQRFEPRKFQIADMVVLDATGAVVAPDLIEFARSKEWRAFFTWRRSRPHVFRSGPVPHTGKGSNWDRYRHPRTLQEKRAAIAAEVDNEPPPRGRRRAHALPSAWDDIWRNPERSWKRHRRTRWR